MTGIGDDELLDLVGMVVRRLLQRMQADDPPAIAETGVREADHMRAGLLELGCVLDADVDGGVEQERPQGIPGTSALAIPKGARIELLAIVAAAKNFVNLFKA